jgi:type I restriction enzyme M protein
MRNKMNESELKEIIKECKKKMEPDGLKTQDQQFPQLCWILLLKCFEDFEKNRAVIDKNYHESILEPYRWEDWAADENHGKTGDPLVKFVDFDLFPALQKLDTTIKGSESTVIVSAFSGFKNRIRNGYALRGIINDINKIRFDKPSQITIFAKVFENELKEWIKIAKDKSYFYTPRVLCEFIVSIMKPNYKKKEIVFDPASGFSGFLIESFNFMKKDEKGKDDIRKLRFDSLKGHEKNPDFFLCGALNYMLQVSYIPNILNANSLERAHGDIPMSGEYDVIMSNPSYNEAEEANVENNLPVNVRSKDSALHFLFLIIEELKVQGRAAMILPDGPLFQADKWSTLRKILLEKCNLHTIIKLPESIFTPRTGISTNILFFEKGTSTKEIWYYEMKVPERVRDPSKKAVKDLKFSFNTNPLEIQDFNEISTWFKNKKVTDNAWIVSIEEIIKNEYSLYVDNPKKKKVDNISPKNLMEQIISNEKNTLLLLQEIEKLIKDNVTE